MSLEMALKAISQKEVVWYRGGLEGRSQRTRTRFYFSNLDAIDFGALGCARV
jgi:hypothetical protein